MTAELAIFTLLKTTPGVTAIVGQRISPGLIPQGTPLPACAYNHISTVERNTPLSFDNPTSVATSRIQITVQASDYPGQKALLRAVRAACRNKQGVFGGVMVQSCLLDTVGPDLRNDDLGIFMQTIDFKVTFEQANP